MVEMVAVSNYARILILLACTAAVLCAPTLDSTSRHKRSFDSFTGAGFTGLDKRSFDSFTGAGFTGLDKRAFDSLAGSGLTPFNKRAFDNFGSGRFGGFDKRAFDSMAGHGFSGFDKRAFDSLAVDLKLSTKDPCEEEILQHYIACRCGHISSSQKNYTENHL